jgi:DNA (cytosine-5)-methyltransferase 1
MVAVVAMNGLVLSIFPGIDLLGRAFEEEGFCVVRGPDLLWGGDIHAFHPPAGRFDGMIGGPPCQAFSRMVHMVKANGYKVADNLIPEFERVVQEAEPAWWIMENVLAAPRPAATKAFYWLTDCDWGGSTQRARCFSSNIELDLWFQAQGIPTHPSVTRDARAVPVAYGGSGKRKEKHVGPGLSVAEMLHRQGFPRELLDECPLTVNGKRSAVGNGVPLAMGRAVAKAVKRAMEAAQSLPPPADPC